MASIKLRTDWDAGRTRRAAKVAGDNDQVRRLLSIAAVYEGLSREDAARLGGHGSPNAAATGCIGSTRRGLRGW